MALLPLPASADHRGTDATGLFAGAGMTAEAYDACALNPGGDPVHHTDMSAECQAVFEPCHVRLHLPSPLQYPDNQYEFEDGTALERCLSTEAERYLVLLDLSTAAQREARTGETATAAQVAAGAGWLVALNYQSSARAGAICGRDYDGAFQMGYLQCLNDAWAARVHDVRSALAEGN